MHKPSIQSIHNAHYHFNEEQPAALILQYNTILNQWKFAGYRCRHCGNSFKGITTCYKHFGLCKELNTTKKRKSTDMPIQTIMVKGERMYRYGDSGKAYKTREEAEKQMKAMYAAGYKEKKDTEKK